MVDGRTLRNVSHEECTACRFDGARYDEAALVEAVKNLAPRWRDLLGTAGEELRQRPSPAVWSAARPLIPMVRTATGSRLAAPERLRRQAR